MIKLLTTEDVQKALMADPYAGWTNEGARALATWLNDDEVYKDLDLDVVEIRGTFFEYGSAFEAALSYGAAWAEITGTDNDPGGHQDGTVCDWLRAKGLHVIEYAGPLGTAVIVSES